MSNNVKRLRDLASYLRMLQLDNDAEFLESLAASLVTQEPAVTVTQGGKYGRGFSDDDWMRLGVMPLGTPLYCHPPTSAVPDKETLRELFYKFHNDRYNPQSEHYRFEHFYKAVLAAQQQGD